MRARWFAPLLALLVWSVGLVTGGRHANAELNRREQLGKLLFFDESLSARGNQSCASCHDPKAGWTGGIEPFNRRGSVYEGSMPGRFGNRKPQSAAYATVAPRFRVIDDEFLGGNFWDGRATGDRLGNPAADQALGPFLNPLEQALPDAAALVARVCKGSYVALFKEIWGVAACEDAARGYEFIALTIAAYEGSADVNRFSSKYDAVLAGTAGLLPEERRGLELFAGKGRCASCHPHTRGANGEPPLFTDFKFDNIGVPRNPANPFYANEEANSAGEAWIDEGLGGFLATQPGHARHSEVNMGKHRSPTLRNVDLRPFPGFVKAYGHNGYFKSLEQMVHFYNTRDVLPGCAGATQRPGVDCWPNPEVAANLNKDELGKLGLTEAEERAIVAFLRTLSDGYTGHPLR